MGRPSGRPNTGYEERREAIAMKLVPAVLADPSASTRALASAAEVSVPTLLHYFGDRGGAVRAAVAVMRKLGAVHVERSATEPHGPPRESLRWLVTSVVEAWRRFGVGTMITGSLSAGLQDRSVGPAFVEDILEPLLQAGERRIAAHVAAGEMPACDARIASLQLLGPIVLALLHQDPLGGSTCRPLDLDALVDEHLARFYRAWLDPA